VLSSLFGPAARRAMLLTGSQTPGVPFKYYMANHPGSRDGTYALSTSCWAVLVSTSRPQPHNRPILSVGDSSDCPLIWKVW
jgi:hypothetical protein